jgi:hypothetical protein
MLVISFYYLRHTDDGYRGNRNILLQDNVIDNICKWAFVG